MPFYEKYYESQKRFVRSGFSTARPKENLQLDFYNKNFFVDSIIPSALNVVECVNNIPDIYKSKYMVVFGIGESEIFFNLIDKNGTEFNIFRDRILIYKLIYENQNIDEHEYLFINSGDVYFKIELIFKEIHSSKKKYSNILSKEEFIKHLIFRIICMMEEN